jgi:hypothetical protein
MPSDFYCKEETSATYDATVEDDAGVAIPAASLSSVVLTLYDVATGTIINLRDGQDVLNANNVTISSSGALQWLMQPEDNIVVTSDSVVEHHKALFEFVASGRESKHEVNIYVSNLAKVP